MCFLCWGHLDPQHLHLHTGKDLSVNYCITTVLKTNFRKRMGLMCVYLTPLQSKNEKWIWEQLRQMCFTKQWLHVRNIAQVLQKLMQKISVVWSYDLLMLQHKLSGNKRDKTHMLYHTREKIYLINAVANLWDPSGVSKHQNDQVCC